LWLFVGYTLLTDLCLSNMGIYKKIGGGGKERGKYLLDPHRVRVHGTCSV